MEKASTIISEIRFCKFKQKSDLGLKCLHHTGIPAIVVLLLFLITFFYCIVSACLCKSTVIYRLKDLLVTFKFMFCSLQ